MQANIIFNKRIHIKECNQTRGSPFRELISSKSHSFIF